jgi:hypothetical protein
MEADDAASFYGARQPGLDRRFLDILEDALHRISRRPHINPKVEGDIHKCRLPRFSKDHPLEAELVAGD